MRLDLLSNFPSEVQLPVIGRVSSRTLVTTTLAVAALALLTSYIGLEVLCVKVIAPTLLACTVVSVTLFVAMFVAIATFDLSSGRVLPLLATAVVISPLLMTGLVIKALAITAIATIALESIALLTLKFFPKQSINIITGGRVNDKFSLFDGKTYLMHLVNRSSLYTGGEEALQALLNNPSTDVNLRDGLYTPLMLAAHKGNLEMVNALLGHENIELDAEGLVGVTALHYAVLGGHVEVARALMAAGASVNPPTHGGMTPLMVAARKGDLEMVNALLGHENIGLDVACPDGVTAMCCAVLGRHIEVIQALVVAGASVINRIEGGVTFLLFAVSRGDLEMVNALLGHENIGLEVEGPGGITAMCAAALDGHIEIARALIVARASVNHQVDGGMTPLMVAAIQGHTLVAQELIDAGADITVRDDQGRTALMHAFDSGSEEVPQVFLSDERSYTNLPVAYEKRVFLYAAKLGVEKVVEYFLCKPQSFESLCEALKASFVNQKLPVAKAILKSILFKRPELTIDEILQRAEIVDEVSITALRQLYRERMAFTRAIEKIGERHNGGEGPLVPSELMNIVSNFL